jgi:hypothetical protein
MNHPENATIGASRPDVEALTQSLADPFDPREVKFKPAVVSGNRAMAIAYVDARVIQDRLDEVLGAAGWQDEYECLPEGGVVCRLRLRLGEEWITKMDVGSPSEQPDEGDRRKAAFSDALKRAAVKFGLGRYLYRLPEQWVDYDPQKRRFVRNPTLPKSALPRRPVAAKVEPATAREAEPKAANPPPADGAELHERLLKFEAQLTKQGLCRAGELVNHVVEAGVKAGYDADLTAWSGPAIALAVQETKTFIARTRRQTVGEQKEVA